MKLCVLTWWLALAVFAGIGLFRWTQFFDPAAPNLNNPEIALDAIVKRHFGIDGGAAVLRQELAAFPSDAPLVVLGPGSDWTLTEAYFATSYLAWPRPVWSVGFVPPGEKAKFDSPPPDGVQAAGFLLYKIPAQAGQPVRRLSDRLAIGKLTP